MRLHRAAPTAVGKPVQHEPRRYFRHMASVMLETLATPPAKVIEIYGLDKVPGPTKSIYARNEAFAKKHKYSGTVLSILSWIPVNFDLAQGGKQLSAALSSLGGAIADSIGYTLVYLHPSLISIGLRKCLGIKDAAVGISRYIEASAIGEIPASVVFFTMLSSIVHGGDQPLVSVGRAVCAALFTSITAFSTWAAVFAPWWTKAVRHEQFHGLGNDLRNFFRGFASGTRPWKPTVPKTAMEEAGAIVGSGFVIWAIPWYIVRVSCAAIVALSGTPPAMFTGALFTLTSMLESFISVPASAVKIHIVEKLLRRSNNSLSESSHENHS